MSTLARAIEIAEQAHAGVLDKGKNPYILHPRRVMDNVTTEDEKIVAILHDVVEDTDATLDDLRKEGFAEHIIEALDCLTRRAGESYSNFIKRVLTNVLAIVVKIQDIKDNMLEWRLPNPLEKEDVARLAKYAKYLKKLESALENWHEVNVEIGR